MNINEKENGPFTKGTIDVSRENGRSYKMILRRQNSLREGPYPFDRCNSESGTVVRWTLRIGPYSYNNKLKKVYNELWF